MEKKRFNKVISEEEEKRLIERWLGSGNSENMGANQLNAFAFSIFSTYGGIEQMDHDDFFSEAGKVFTYCLKNFDPEREASFKTYLNLSLRKKFSSLLTYRNRISRGGKKIEVIDEKTGKKVEKYIAERALSLDAPCSNDCDEPLMNVIVGNKTVEDYIPELKRESCVEIFLKNISRKNRRIAMLIVDGYTRTDICEILHIKDYDYDQALKEFRISKNAKILLGGRAR